MVYEEFICRNGFDIWKLSNMFNKVVMKTVTERYFQNIITSNSFDMQLDWLVCYLATVSLYFHNFKQKLNSNVFYNYKIIYISLLQTSRKIYGFYATISWSSLIIHINLSFCNFCSECNSVNISVRKCGNIYQAFVV